MSDALVSSLRELAAKATPAPWHEDGGYISGTPGRDVLNPWDGFLFEDDPTFIVALRNAWPSLLARIEAGERLAEAARAVDGLAQYQDSRTLGPAVRRDLVDTLHAALEEYRKAKEGV